ncbi:Uncharacterized protein FWK35_00027209, partial [Aphis craccivora]
VFPGAFENYLEFQKNDLHNASTRFTFEPEKLLKMKIEALFRHVFVYTDIIKSIHSSLRSESKIRPRNSVFPKLVNTLYEDYVVQRFPTFLVVRTTNFVKKSLRPTRPL